MRITWERRATPLEPAAVLALDGAVPALARALVASVEAGTRLAVHAGEGHLLATGAAADLPWVDGVTWLGRDGALLVPTTLVAGPEPSLVGRAVARRMPHAAWIALLPDRILAGERSTGEVDAERLRALADRPPVA